jgi:hypothetical protein
VWACPDTCGKHRTAMPRHSEISAGVVGAIMKDLACLEEGWLQ